MALLVAASLVTQVGTPLHAGPLARIPSSVNSNQVETQALIPCLALAVFVGAAMIHPTPFQPVYQTLNTTPDLAFPVAHAGLGILTVLLSAWDRGSGSGSIRNLFHSAGSFEETQQRIRERWNLKSYTPVDDVLDQLEIYVRDEQNPIFKATMTSIQQNLKTMTDERFEQEFNRVADLDTEKFYAFQMGEPPVRTFRQWLQRDYRLHDTPRQIAQTLTSRMLLETLPVLDEFHLLFTKDVLTAYQQALVLIELRRRWKAYDEKHIERLTGPFGQIWELVLKRIPRKPTSLFENLESFESVFKDNSKTYEAISGQKLLDLHVLLAGDLSSQLADKVQRDRAYFKKMTHEKQIEQEFDRIARRFPPNYLPPGVHKMYFSEWLHIPLYLFYVTQSVGLDIVKYQAELQHPMSDIDRAHTLALLDRSFEFAIVLDRAIQMWRERDAGRYRRFKWFRSMFVIGAFATLLSGGISQAPIRPISSPHLAVCA
jgi:hypothetical protein